MLTRFWLLSACLLSLAAPLVCLTTCTQDGRSSAANHSTTATTTAIQWGRPIGDVRLGISCNAGNAELGRTVLLGLHVQNVGNQPVLFPDLLKLADRQFCVMLSPTVEGTIRAWGEPATPGPVGPEVFLELGPGEVVSRRLEITPSSPWFRRGETVHLEFQVNSDNFRQASEAKKIAEGVLLRVWSGRAHSGSESLRFD